MKGLACPCAAHFKQRSLLEGQQTQELTENEGEHTQRGEKSQESSENSFLSIMLSREDLCFPFIPYYYHLFATSQPLRV